MTAERFSALLQITGNIVPEGLEKYIGDLLDNMDNPALEKYRDREVIRSYTVGELEELLGLEKGENAGEALNDPLTFGQILDILKDSEILKARRDQAFTLKTTLGEMIDLFGEENVRNFVQEKTAAAAHKAEYENTADNILRNWAFLFLFILVFSLLATIMLEMIDKDKR